MDMISAGVGLFGKLAETGLWLKIVELAAGDAFFPLMGLLPMMALIVLAWRSPKIAWFNGTWAVVVVGLICTMALIALLIVAWNREVPHRASGAGNRAGGGQKAAPEPRRAPEFDIGG